MDVPLSGSLNCPFDLPTALRPWLAGCLETVRTLDFQIFRFHFINRKPWCIRIGNVHHPHTMCPNEREGA